MFWVSEEKKITIRSKKKEHKNWEAIRLGLFWVIAIIQRASIRLDWLIVELTKRHANRFFCSIASFSLFCTHLFFLLNQMLTIYTYAEWIQCF